MDKSGVFDYLDHLKILNLENYDKMIKHYANSDLPNSWFVAPFTNCCLDAFKDYLHFFARVITFRGLPKINDIKTEMLFWLQDVNWPGAGEICYFIRDNFLDFKDLIIRQIFHALDIEEDLYLKGEKHNDIVWAEALLGQFADIERNSESKKIINETFDMFINYNKDDSKMKVLLKENLEKIFTIYPLSNWT